MKKNTLPEKLNCLFWVFVGSMICAFGIELTLIAGVGVDPITMFEEGVSKTTGISVGTVTLMLNFFVMALGFVLRRDAINWGTVVCTFSVGPFINVWSTLGITASESFAGRVLLDVLGVLIIGLGIAVYMLPEYGVGGMEALMLFFTDRFKTPMGPTRVVQDCIWGLIGLL
ncbi:MAG: YitT family protein, partial [Angelakisella sp.]